MRAPNPLHCGSDLLVRTCRTGIDSADPAFCCWRCRLSTAQHSGRGIRAGRQAGDGSRPRSGDGKSLAGRRARSRPSPRQRDLWRAGLARSAPRPIWKAAAARWRSTATADRKDKRQIVFGVLCNQEGCPVAVEVFAGNTADPSTLKSQIDKLKHRFHLGRVVLVGIAA
jgi:hypothetical protein